MRLGSHDLVPYALGHHVLAAPFVERAPVSGMRLLEALDEANLPFLRLLDAADRRAFGADAMPPWVQVDLATLATATVGFALPREAVPGDLYEELLEALDDTLPGPDAEAMGTYDGLVPVSAYVAAFTPRRGTVMGFRLHAHLPGHRLGLRTKALALACYEAKAQMGVAPWEARGIAVHTALGPLRLLRASVPGRPAGRATFAYVLAVPSAEELRQVVRTGEPVAAPDEGADRIPLDEDTPRRIADRRAQGPVFIVGASGSALLVTGPVGSAPAEAAE